MRDILDDLFGREPLDPTEAARRNMRPQLRKRFYRRVTVGEEAPFPVLLDGRPVKTPAKNLLAAPVRALSQAIAAEWDAQDARIDPAVMPLTRLANSILDGVAAAPAPVADEIAKFLGSDLLCYRAGTPEGLVAAQARHWDPILAWAREALGARFVLGEGVMFVAQPEHAVAAARAALPADPWRLGAAHVITTLTGSALIALAVAQGRLDAEQAWDAAHVDEDWNMHLWGRDELALQRRAARFAEMQAAATVLALV
jgi:chaperone required for assembly of F1-ATPase